MVAILKKANKDYYKSSNENQVTDNLNALFYMTSAKNLEMNLRKQIIFNILIINQKYQFGNIYY